MRKIFDITMKTGKTTLAAMVAGIVSNKFIALLLGPQGVGLIAQAKAFLNTTRDVSGLGLQTGVAKYVAQYKEEGNTENIKRVVFTAFFSHSLIIVIMLIVILLLSRKLSFYVFADERYKPYIILFSLAIPLVTLAHLFTSILVGYRKVNQFVSARLSGIFIGLSATLLLVYFFGVRGGLVQVFIGSLILFLCFLYFYRRSVPGGLFFPREFVGGIFRNWRNIIDKRLYVFSITTFISVFIGSISILIVRSRIIHVLGVEQNGIYQVAFAMSAYYFPFITNGLWFHFLPEISSMKLKEDFNKEINKTLRFCVLILTPTICLLLIVRKLFIKILFSKEFLLASSIIPLQLIGDFFHVMVYTFGTFLLARAMVWPRTFFVAYQNFFYVLISYTLLSYIGIIAVPLAYAIGMFLTALAIFIYHRRVIDFRVDKRNVKVFTYSLLLIILIALAPFEKYFIGYVSGVLFIIIWALIVIKKEEFLDMFKWASGLMKKKT